MSDYRILLHRQAADKAAGYRRQLAAGSAEPGRYLAEQLAGTAPADLSAEAFLEHLLATKQPLIFAESAVSGDGSDWNLAELSVLGDIAIAVPVQVFDDGRHSRPRVHPQPLQATLLFVPGALLRNGRHCTPADWPEVVRDGAIHPPGYRALYQRRLLPTLAYASAQAEARGRQALVTLPGLGCGQFAGPFRGQLGVQLEHALQAILQRHHQQLPGLRALYYDPFQECANQRQEIGHLSFLTRPLTQGNETKPQLCPPTDYAEAGDDFSNCDLFSIVAWDHVSWPGNDFFSGARATDDGVKAAATDSMAAMTGVQGQYDPITNRYQPPEAYQDWQQVIEHIAPVLEVAERLQITGAATD